jgi:hypothetical protein
MLFYRSGLLPSDGLGLIASIKKLWRQAKRLQPGEHRRDVHVWELDRVGGVSIYRGRAAK